MAARMTERNRWPIENFPKPQQSVAEVYILKPQRIKGFVEAAARLYFGKRAKDVTLEEAAMIAGIIQTPSRQSPYVNRTAAKFRA